MIFMMRSTFTSSVLILLLLFPFFGNAQTAEGNLDFENWTVNALGWDQPNGYAATYLGSENTTDPVSGGSALKVETAEENNVYNDTVGVCVSSSVTFTGDVVLGEPYSKRPDSATGFIRADIPDGDTGFVSFELSKYDASAGVRRSVGVAQGVVPDTIPSWTPVGLEFQYDTCLTPDTLTIIFASEGKTYFNTGGVTIGGSLEADGWSLHTPAPQITNILTQPETCNTAGNDGEIEVQAEEVDSCAEYSVDGGSSWQNDSIFSSVDSGMHEVIVMTDNGSDTMMATVDSVVTHSIDSVDVTDADCGMANGSFTVHASGGTEPYEFSDNNGGNYQNDSTFLNQTSGVYDIAVKDANGCVVYGQVSVGSTSSLSIDSLSMEKEACNMGDGMITVHASGGTKPYSFSIDGGAPQPDSIFSGLSSGTYDLSVQDANNCTVDTLNVFLDSAEAPTISGVNVTNATCGMSDGGLSINASGGQGALEYSNDGGMGYQASSSFSSLSTGTYQTMVKDSNGCKDSMTVQVDTNLVPVAMASSDTDSVDLAVDSTVQFDGSGSQGNSFSWSFGDGASASGMNVSHDYSSTGSYTVWLVATAGNCKDSSKVTIDVVKYSSLADRDRGDASIELLPNPSNGRLEVAMEQKRSGTIEVLDLTGRVVHTQALDRTQRTRMDLSDREEGVYFLRIIDREGSTIGTERLILTD